MLEDGVHVFHILHQAQVSLYSMNCVHGHKTEGPARYLIKSRLRAGVDDLLGGGEVEPTEGVEEARHQVLCNDLELVLLFRTEVYRAEMG